MRRLIQEDALVLTVALGFCSFGYMDGNEIINQVVAEWIAPPALVVYDPVKELYYIFPETTELTTPGDIQMFLDGILVGKIKVPHLFTTPMLEFVVCTKG